MSKHMPPQMVHVLDGAEALAVGEAEGAGKGDASEQAVSGVKRKRPSDAASSAAEHEPQSLPRAAVITRSSWGALPLDVVGLITVALGPHALPLVSRELLYLCDQLPTLSICGPLSAAAAAALNAVLCRGSRMRYVRQLRLKNCAVTGDMLAIGVRIAPQLTQLYLPYNSIDDAGARAVAEALPHVPQLTHLNLRRNSIGEAGARAAAEALRHVRQLTRLVLSENDISEAGACAVAEALRYVPQLTQLDLSCNSIGDG